MSKWYTEQCPVLVDLTKALREVGLEWLTLNVEHTARAGWSIKGTVGCQQPKVTVAKGLLPYICEACFNVEIPAEEVGSEGKAVCSECDGSVTTRDSAPESSGTTGGEVQHGVSDRPDAKPCQSFQPHPGFTGRLCVCGWVREFHVDLESGCKPLCEPDHHHPLCKLDGGGPRV